MSEKIFRFREKEFWLLILAGISSFYRPLLFGETFFFRDLYLHFYPQKLRFVDFIRNGEFPLWDQYVHGGQPFLADLNNMALYPSNLIYLMLPPVAAFNLDIIFHVLLSAASAYWLARNLGVSATSSVVAGAVYGFCGYMFSLTNLLNRLSAMPYLPLMLIAMHAFFSQRRTIWLALGVLFGALQLLAGAPEMSMLSMLTVFGWLLFVVRHPLSKKVTVFALMMLLILGVSSIQTLPAAEMVKQSIRSAGSDYQSFSAWSLHPKRIPETFLPGFLGETDRITKKHYWGTGFESMGFPFILSIYFGWLSLTMAFTGAFRRTDVPASTRYFLLGVVLASFIAAFGRYLPGFSWFFEQAPLPGGIRYPIKFLAGALLPLALLAAFGLDSIAHSEKPSKRHLMWFWFSSAIFLTGVLLFASKSAGASFITTYFGTSSSVAVEGLRRTFLHAALIALTATVILHRHNRLKHISHGLLAALVLLDLLWNGTRVNHYAPSEFFTEQPRLVESVQKQLAGGRLYRAPNANNIIFQMPQDDVTYLYRWNLETLHNYSGALYNIPVIYHEDYDNLAQRELVRISDHVTRSSWERKLPLLTAGSVSLILTQEQIVHPQLQLLANVRNASNKPFFLLRNLAYTKEPFLVTNSVTVESNEQAFVRMNDPQFDPARTVVLFHAPQNTELQNEETCGKYTVTYLEKQSFRSKIRVQSACDGYLYFARPFYEGWKTFVDGIEVPVVRANYSFTASFVKSGDHTIDTVYAPQSVRIGILLSIASLLILWILCRWFLRGIF